MSIRHCIAGVVLVVAGGLAVNAYQDQPASSDSGNRRQLPASVSEIQIQDERVKSLEALQEQVRVQLNTAKQVRADMVPVAVAAIKKTETKEVQTTDSRDPTSHPEGWRYEYKEIPRVDPTLPPSIVSVDRHKSAPPSSSPVGRYQFVNRTTDGLLVDTTTGHCWTLTGVEWKDVGLPKSIESANKEAPPQNLNLKPNLKPSEPTPQDAVQKVKVPFFQRQGGDVFGKKE